MKIKVKGIPVDGLEISRSVEPEEIGLSEDDMACVEPLEITARIEKVQNTIIAQVEVKAQVSYVCARCLEDVEKKTTDQFKFEYVVEKNTEFIDLSEDIRQELILQNPAKVLCSEDCRGICPHCGANLNDEECGCSK